VRWVVYVWLPGLLARAEEAAGGEGRPVAVVKDGRLLDVSAAAAGRGMSPGLSLPAARALCPEALFRPYREELYPAEATGAWEIYARYSPRVEPDGPQGAFLELLCHDILREAGKLLAETRATLKLAAVAGAAPGKLAARLACRRAGKDGLRIVFPEEVEEFLAAVPLEELWRLDRARREELGRLGLRRLGDLARFSAEELAGRFGPAGRRLAAWSRGQDAERVKALYPPPRWELHLEREGGEELASALGRLAHGLWERLETKGQAAGELVLELHPGGRGCRRFTRPPVSVGGLTAALTGLARGLLDGKREPLALRATVIGVPRVWRQLTFEGKEEKEALQRVLEVLGEHHAGTVRRGAGREERREKLLALFDPLRLGP